MQDVVEQPKVQGAANERIGSLRANPNNVPATNASELKYLLISLFPPKTFQTFAYGKRFATKTATPETLTDLPSSFVRLMSNPQRPNSISSA